MKHLAEVSLPAVLENLTQLKETVVRAVRQAGLTEDNTNQIELAVEEAVVNIMSHAYPGQTGEVSVEIWSAEAGLSVRIIDTGIPFDPTSAPQGLPSLSLDNRPIGGLGLLLLKNSTDSLRYERNEDRNILTLEFFR